MLGEPLLRLDETDSTNRVALDWEEAPHGAAVFARAQTGGRGRLGRAWESAAGKGLYLSLVLRNTAPNAAIYALLGALGAARALQKMTEVKCRVKWPNDVLALSPRGEARKIGGILGEARGDKLVIGIGININQSHEELPDRPIFPASSLRLESGRNWEIEAVSSAILGELEGLFSQLEAGEWEKLRAEFERVCLGVGEAVEVRTSGANLVGVFESIGEDGALILRTASGPRRVLAGDVNYF